MILKIALIILTLISLKLQAQITTIFHDNFENKIFDWQFTGAVFPNKWVKGNCTNNGTSLPGDSAMYISDGSGGNGCNKGYVYQNAPAGSAYALAYQPIDAKCKSSLQINFDYKTEGIISEDYTELVYSTDGGTVWQPIGSRLSINPTWSNSSISLPSVLDYSSFLLGFRFTYNNVNTFGSPIAIDNVKISGLSYEASILIDSISLCQIKSVNIEALPAINGKGKWSSLNSPQVTFNDPAASKTGVNNLKIGTNTLLWTISSTHCGNLTDTMHVYVYEKPLPAKTLDTVILCFDKPLELNANYPLYGSGSWTTDQGALIANKNSHQTIATQLNIAWHRFIWKVENGACPSTADTMHVYMAPRAKMNQLDTSMCIENLGLQLNGNSGVMNENYLWKFISGNGKLSSPFDNQTAVTELAVGLNKLLYTITSDVCLATYDTLEILIKQCKVFEPEFPTVITPNADGKNDRFVISNLDELYPNCEIKIFNRWGGIVFESIGYTDPWNGTFKNEELPMGTYFYKLELKDEARTVFHGPISILR